MAKSVIVCFKNEVTKNLSKYIETIPELITPNNVKKNDPYVYQKRKMFGMVINPTSSIKTDKAGSCLGVVANFSNEHWIPRIKIEEGTYALLRHDEKYVELVSDFTSTRTIWYVHTEKYFIASTSQRMIIAFLGTFEFNIDAARWMLSAGVIGPGNSWDKRIKSVPCNSSILLDRSTWELKASINIDHNIVPLKKDLDWHKKNIEKALRESLLNSGIDYENWTLALSGGLDSRSIIFYLEKENYKKRSITWGIDGAQGEKNTDAHIANLLADRCNYEHKYMATDQDPNDFSIILDRYLSAGEGRVDHLSAYMDGLNLWKELHDAGRGILRGYDAQGATTRVVRNERQARLASTLILSSDYKDLDLPQSLILTESDIPISLKRSSRESIEQWRDRLWLSFRTPVVTAALDEIKVAYVEIINPLLFRRIVDAIKLLPNKYRIIRKIFESLSIRWFLKFLSARED
jgi:hypothetical protein